MWEGARMHRKLQSEEGPEYTPEVPLVYYHPLSRAEDACIVLEGRADGIFYGVNPEFPLLGDAWTVDEIKTTYGDVTKMKEPVPVHLAQAYCYAFIYAVTHGLDLIRVRMRYCSLATEEIQDFYQEKTREEIEQWFEELIGAYEKWAMLQIEWEKVRTASLQALKFPYDYREGQKNLAVYVYRTIVHGKKLFLEAPTGTGKTLAVLFPSLKAMGEAKAEKIFYLTAKNVTAEVPVNALDLLRRAENLRLKSVQIFAKEKMCSMEKPSCNPDDCPRAAGHFDRVNDALYELLTSGENYDKQSILACAEKHQVCPFELSLEVTLFSDVIIGDYNYLYDPHAKLKRFFVKGTSKDPYIFLVDEAHNLVDRGRDMYSARLYREQVTAFAAKAQEVYPGLYKKLDELERKMLPLGYEKPTEIEDLTPVMDAVNAVNVQMEQILSRQRKEGGKKLSAARKKIRDDFMEFYFVIRHFLQMYEESDGDYVFYSEREDDALKLCLYCVDPSRQLAQCMEKGAASVLFSATFLPIQYYKRLLGGDEQDYEVYAHSVFDPEKRGLFIVSDVTSRYRDRNEQQYRKIATCIHGAVSARHGNYLVFFPSYSFMESVLAVYRELFPETSEVEYLVQEAQMKEEERLAFLKRFEEFHDDQSLLGFSVLGGVFSEGIDLRNDRLIGVMVVGTGFPKVGAEREFLKNYFEERGENGFDYAYTYPGMNKVLQAAGRVIRTSDDVGIIGLLDERFTRYQYRQLFPAEWSGYKVTTTDKIGDRVSVFWDEWL